MGRSAKFMKKPSKKERQARDTVKAASRPVRPRSPTPPPKEEGDGANKVKKRRMMRAKVDKVGSGAALIESLADM